jgi:predicted metal-dependent phosphoesterase TrpH
VVVEKAREAGLRAIALTDHDSVSGVAETMRLGKAAGLEVVPGIELSTNYEGCDFHILGYFVDHEDRQILNAVRFLKDERDRRGERIVEKLNELGIRVTIEDVRRYHTGGTLGRPHVARALEGLGLVGCVEEAFTRFLRTGAPAFVEKYRLNTLEGIALLRAAGAAAVLAHPGASEKPELVPEILEAGVDGIEIHHPRNPPDAVEAYRAEAEKRGLIQTGGSDSHGNVARDREAGIGDVSVPYEVVEQLRAVARRS